MVEALALHGSGPRCAGGVQQVDGANDVGLDKGHRIGDGSVHVALGREVDDSVGLVSVHEVLNGGGVADVDALKAVVGGLIDVREVFKVAGVRQRVNIDDGGLGVALYKTANDVRADESGSAGNEDCGHHISPLR